jgi:hypothetical protein
MQSRAQLISHLDEQIVALERQLRDLKFRRNALMPLCSLPPETLARVLQFAQISSGYITSVIDPDENLNPEWLNYMLICKHIRDVALATPALWTFIKCQTTKSLGEWRPLCVERARDYPLEISGRDHHLNTYMVPAEKIASSYLARAGRLHVLTHSEKPPFGYKEVLAAPLPILRDLRWDLLSLKLDPRALKEVSKSLRYLALRYITYDDIWENSDDIPTFPELLFLHLDIGEEQQDQRLYMALITHMPHIEGLAITAPWYSDFTSIPNQRILIPGLRSLHISGPSRAICALTRAFSRPQEHLSVEVIDEGGKLDSETWDYILGFWSNAAHGKPLPAGCLEWSNSRPRNLVTFGSKFDFDELDYGPRIFIQCCYQAADLCVPAQLKERVESVHFSGYAAQAEVVWPHNLVRFIVLKKIFKLEHLPSGFDAWLHGLAKDGRPLEMVKFEHCGQAWKSLRVCSETKRREGS